MAAKQDAAKAATRGFLAQIGPKYDAMNLGLAPKDLAQKAMHRMLLEEFENACVYCDVKLTDKTIQMDHVVPMNKASMGLHMLGNLAASCSACNQAKAGKTLEVFLADRPLVEQKRIISFLNSRKKKYGADISLPELQVLADDLYKDVASFVEFKIAKALGALPTAGTVAKSTMDQLQKKAEFDFSEIAKSHPIGALVRAKADGQTGVIVDYSLEGLKGKRTPYVVFLSDQSNRKVTRSPNQVVLRKRA